MRILKFYYLNCEANPSKSIPKKLLNGFSTIMRKKAFTTPTKITFASIPTDEGRS